VANGRPLPSAADGKISSVFAVRRMMSSTRHYMAGSLPSATDGKVQVLCRPPLMAKSLPSATVGKVTKWVSSQEAQLDATCLLCRRWQTAKSPLPSVADGKEPALALFSVFLNPTIFTANIYDIYRYISQSYLTAHKFHRTYIYSSIHSYIASSIKIAKLHIHITMQSFIKIASSIVAS